MNLWPILLIALALALVIGPVMMFKPSRRDTHLAALRQLAATNGVTVRLRQLERSGVTTSVAEYALPVNENLSDTGDWLLLRQSFAHEVHFNEYWHWENPQKQAPAALWDALLKQSSSAPASIYGIGGTATSIYILWNEKGDNFVDILQRLTTLREMC